MAGTVRRGSLDLSDPEASLCQAALFDPKNRALPDIRRRAKLDQTARTARTRNSQQRDRLSRLRTS